MDKYDFDIHMATLISYYEEISIVELQSAAKIIWDSECIGLGLVEWYRDSYTDISI